MKNLLFGALLLSFMSACNSDNIANQEDLSQDPGIPSGTTALKRSCPSDLIRQERLKNNPALRAKFEANELQTEKFSRDLAMGKVLADGTVEIPVIFNVIYNTTAQNISDARIAEQIAVLNADYSATNSDIGDIPTEFQPAAAGNVKISFKLVKINRKQSSKTAWKSTVDEMKYSANGGIDATDTTKNLNIWVVNSILDNKNKPGTLGYAYYPEDAGLEDDGVVLDYRYVGKTGATFPYNLGRTATHEVGHYLNLPHLWGSSDNGCETDFSADTPASPGPNFDEPSYPLYAVCGGINRSQMFMNYMDYVDDRAMCMFSANQKTRMRAVVATNGPRAGLR
ncbi:zinc metalloprotease [Chryseobacterium herbae]|uniref:Zinc metalloprotease n=1 Tax=Chryseobacterium herbae TaxID=2976476 RepID=A0ABT2IVP3_9FLAO|nr:zinc metalloprotease [Chryseobacterium sp. pc1-10]MCT2562911.1 zinc metalloprotease [Chryseobacterium sp. pc1-10]